MRMLDLSEPVPCRGCVARWSWCASPICREEGGRLEGQSIRCSFDLRYFSTDRCNLATSMHIKWLPTRPIFKLRSETFDDVINSADKNALATMICWLRNQFFFQEWFIISHSWYWFARLLSFVRIGWDCNRNLVGKPSTKCFSLLVVLSFIAVNGLCLAESQLTVEVMFCSAFCPWCKNYLNASWQTRNKHLNTSTFEHNDKHLSSGSGQSG